MKTNLMNTNEAAAFKKDAAAFKSEAATLRNRPALRMKKFLAIIFLLALVFSLGPVGSSPLGSTASVQAQTRRYRQRRHRTFWQKHRDKLTLAGTTAGGAAVGGIAGGKKGAAIGSLVGLGGGALYTYKIRKRHKHRRY